MTQQISLEPALTRSLSAGTSLPLDVLEDAARRIRALCVVMASVAVANEITRLTFRAPFLPEGARTWSTALILAASGALFWLSYRLAPRRVIDVGLGYAVLLGAVFAATSVPATWFPRPAPAFLWSSNAVWVLVFPAMIPSTLRRTVLAAVVAAAAEPVAVVWYAMTGYGALPSIGEAAARLWPNALAVGVAVVTTRAIHRLGERLRSARSVGSYRLIRPLGEGGMGQVWEASHRLLARPAAVKLISPDALGGDTAAAERMFRRFEREAQATAQLQSPHTIGVYDFGIARDGSFYYVMELLDGLDLHSLIVDDGAQPAERVVYVLMQACRSLAEAHERGLIHRDIKPANLFLCRYGLETDFVKVLDFGLVRPRERDDAAEPDLRLTQRQAVVGTPGFIAPEVTTGQPVDGRADLYSLGCVAYWLLTGRDVFEGRNVMAQLVAHVHERPRPPAALVSDLSPGLNTLVLDLLQKDPARRPQTARAVEDQLAALGLAPRWTAERRRTWWGSRPVRGPAVPEDATTAPTRRL